MLMKTSSQCAASRNHFLTGLSRDDAALLDGLLERVVIQPGTMLAARGAPIDFIYFPETIVVSLGGRLDAGHHVETAVVGYEGIIGWSALTGSRRASHDAIVQMSAGTALRISRLDFQRACETSATLPAVAMRFADAVAVQTEQAVFSALRDTVERRLCRWLLMRHDRIFTDQLFVRHDEISFNLGTRRASVTDSLHILEGERLLRCRRGRIIVLNRQGLEHTAVHAYGFAEAYYREYIGPFGRSTVAHGR